MRLSNELIYNGQMKCANEEVAEARISLSSDQLLKWKSMVQVT